MLSLAAISLPFSMPAFERSEPEDWGCILVAEAYFSSMTDGRPCSVVLGVSSTIPLQHRRSYGVWWCKPKCTYMTSREMCRSGLNVISPVHSELSCNSVETKRHEGHVCDALAGARRRALFHRDLEQAKVHLQGRERKENKMYWLEVTGMFHTIHKIGANINTLKQKNLFKKMKHCATEMKAVL